MRMIQKQVLYKAIKEPMFAKDVLSKLPAKTFDEKQEYKELFIIIKRYYQTNDKILDEGTFLTLTEEYLGRKRVEEDVYSNFYDEIHSIYTIDTEDQNDEVIDSSIQKFVRRTLSLDLIQKTLATGDVEDEDTLVELADGLRDITLMGVGNTHGFLLDFFEDVETKRQLLSNMNVHRYPTGFASIDTVTDGGLARGEMGLINAVTGGGKSTWAVQQSSNYLKQGMNVVYFVLEEKIDRMILKMEQSITGASKSVFLNDDKTLRVDVYDQVQELYTGQANLGRLFLSKHNPQEMTSAMLEQVIVDITLRKGLQVDAVIIDYPDLMRNHFTKESESDAGGKLYEVLRGLASKHNYVCWVLSQLNRSGLGQDTKSAEFIEGSKRKLNAVEFSGTVNQTGREFEEGKLRLYLDKIRYTDGRTFDKMQYFKIDTTSMTITSENPEEIAEHKAILDAEGSYGYGDKKETTYSEVQSNLESVNNKLTV